MISHFSHVQLFETLWTTAHQALLSMGFSRQEYWSELPCHPPGDLPNPGIKPWSPALQADTLPSEPPGKPRKTGVGCHFLLQEVTTLMNNTVGFAQIMLKRCDVAYTPRRL